LQVPYKAQSSTSHALQNIIILIVTVHTLQCIIFLVIYVSHSLQIYEVPPRSYKFSSSFKVGEGQGWPLAFLVFSHRELGLPSSFTCSQTNKGIPLDLPVHSRFPIDDARLLVSSLVLIFFFQTFSFSKISNLVPHTHIYRTQNLVLSPGIKLIQL